MSATPPPASFRVGLIGHGIGPSLTPAMHIREAARLGLDYHYETIDLIDQPHVDLGTELARLEAAGFAAVNVTHPFKQQVLEHVHHTSDAVGRIGAANLVLLGPGARVAHNTDYSGFRSGLERFLGERPRATVLQVGAGGAGLATACALIDLGFAEVVIHDRQQTASERLVARFGAGDRLKTSGGDLDGWLRRVSGIVHVTPVGMREHPGIALDVDSLKAQAWVAEVVYRPLETELVRRARGRGLATLDGGAMAVGQAVESIRLITGREPDAARMHAHFDQLAAGGSAA
ncbi:MULTISPECIES: shikimate dehydrogenase [Nocardioides]|uniref:Shikimate dehydrogenase n=1 Tax=Nocardioides vastitatis TaxID=2568655 RepID=A0ABW0ZER8_9ACTN|nr:shikimate dehydrogenase [Nocardioides sp.]THJ04325.1 shikimate dehydrogenase [Nocardioides sp.]